MYAPLDLRLVIDHRSLMYNRPVVMQRRSSETGLCGGGVPPRQDGAKPRPTLSCKFRFRLGCCPSCRLQRVVDQVRDYAAADHDQSKQKRAHAEHNFMFAAED